MSDRSAIEWTDATWNPVRGCTKVSPGCKFCYAETFAERFRGVPAHPFEQGFDLKLVPEKLEQPLQWRRPRKIFVNSRSDVFHEDVPADFDLREIDWVIVGGESGPHARPMLRDWVVNIRRQLSRAAGACPAATEHANRLLDERQSGVELAETFADILDTQTVGE